MAAEITLGATALFAPLLHAIRLCYNVKKLSDGFGEDMVTYERRLRSQLAILEVLFDTNLSQLASEEIQRSVSQGPTKPDKVGGVAKTICSELDSMRNNTRICCDLMNEYSGYHKSPVTSRPDSRSPPIPQYSPARLPSDPAGATKPEVATERSSSQTSSIVKRIRQLLKPRSCSSQLLAPSPGGTSPEVSDGSTQSTPLTIPSTPSGSSVPISLSGTTQENANILQDSVPLRRRLKWATSDRQKYEDSLRELTRSNNVLQSLFILRAVQNEEIHLSLHSSGREQATSEFLKHNTTHLTCGSSSMQVTGIQPASKEISLPMVLQTLHHALVYSTRPHQGQKSRLEFGIKLEENPHAIKERVRDQEDLCLEDTYLFALQVHKAGSESGERSHCLLVEVPTSDVHQADNLSQPIHHLHLTIRDEVDGTDEEACYTLLGHVSEPSATKTPASCRVFQDQTETYITKKTLVDFLQEPKFRTTKYVNQHMQLARLVVNTYLNFAPMERVLGSSCALARNYRYYVATSDIKEAVVPTLPPSESFLNPFLFCGFGSKQKRYGGRSLVQSNGVSSLTSADIRIMELGLLLFQIGSWQSLDCSFPQEADYEDMRRKAKAKMYSVHKHCGVRFGELVLTCLDWRGQKGKGKEASPDPAGGMVSGDDEAALAVKIIGVLKDLENRLQVMRGQPSFLIPFLQVNSYA